MTADQWKFLIVVTCAIAAVILAAAWGSFLTIESVTHWYEYYWGRVALHRKARDAALEHLADCAENERAQLAEITRLKAELKAAERTIEAQASTIWSLQQQLERARITTGDNRNAS